MKTYSGLEAILIPINGSEFSTASVKSQCAPIWNANDIIQWHGFTVCKQMIDESDEWTGQYDTVPD